MTAAARRAAPPPHQAHPKPSRQDRLAQEREEREKVLLARAELRHDVLVRAQCRCEACGADLTKAGYVMDHWLGGFGRREQLESLQTTWALCLDCNEKRTANLPSAAAWNEKFEAHCKRHRYRFTPHVTKFQVLAELAGRSRP